MNTENQANVFNAFISRVSSDRLREIASKVEQCEEAQLNLGNTGQVEAQQSLKQAVQSLVESLPVTDQELIGNIININS